MSLIMLYLSWSSICVRNTSQTFSLTLKLLHIILRSRIVGGEWLRCVEMFLTETRSRCARNYKPMWRAARLRIVSLRLSFMWKNFWYEKYLTSFQTRNLDRKNIPYWNVNKSNENGVSKNSSIAEHNLCRGLIAKLVRLITNFIFNSKIQTYYTIW